MLISFQKNNVYLETYSMYVHVFAPEAVPSV